MPFVILIKVKNADNTQKELIQFKNVDFIRDFYVKRKYTDNKDHETNVISVHVLRNELQKELERVQERGDVGAYVRLKTAHDDLAHVIKTKITKGDTLIYHCAAKSRLIKTM